MAIETDSYYDIIKDGVTLDRIGLSKTLNNYTIAEIADYAFVGSYSQCGKQIMPKSESGWTYVGYSQSHGSCPFAAAFHSGGYDRLDIEDGLTEDYNLTENGIYRKVVLLHDTTGTYQFNLTTSSLANMKIITEFDAPKYTMDFGSKSDMLTSESGSHYWRPYEQSSKYNTHLGYSNNEQLSTCGFQAYIIIEYNNTYYFIMANVINKIFSGQLFQATNINNSNISVCANQIVDYQNSNPAGIAETVTQWFSNYDFTGDNPTPIVQYLFSDAEYWNDYGGYCSVILFHDKGFRQVFNFTEEYNLLLFIAGCYGLHFIVDGTVYKPIISDNFVTGYTTDLTQASDLDGYTGSTKHTMPITPPSPTPPGPTPGPYDDDPWSGVSFSGVGVGGAGAFAKCYYMTSTELANLRSWMNSNSVPEGFDPMAQIIGLSQVPVTLSGDDNTTVQFVNSSAVYDPGVTRLVDSGVNTQISMGAPKRYSLGSVDIVRRMQERGEPYLDYDCQIELYLPLIGMFSVDTQAVMGRTITAEAVLDPISGTLAAYAYVSRDGQNLPIAYGSTTIGVDLPISAQQYSVSRAALKQANAQLGSSILSSTLSFIAAATAGGKGSGAGAKTATGSTNGLAAAGIREAGADYMKASQAGNVFGDFMQWGRTIRQLSYGNNTAIAGSFGGSTAQWSYPFTPYVKIIRPRYEKPSNYAHSQGVPCVQTKKVGSCTGFIQCIGVDVSGITRATDLERQAIQAALANGVFAGGGS